MKLAEKWKWDSENIGIVVFDDKEPGKAKTLGGPDEVLPIHEAFVEKYSKNQPRDREGQWTSTGAGGGGNTISPLVATPDSVAKALAGTEAIEKHFDEEWTQAKMKQYAKAHYEASGYAPKYHSSYFYDRGEIRKMQVEDAIASKIMSNNKMVEQLRMSQLSQRDRMELVHTLVRDYIDNWAKTSGDNSAHAVTMQRTAQKEFGLKDASVDHLPSKLGRSDSPPMASFLQAQYESTQAVLKSKGVDSVVVFRGVQSKRTPLKEGEDVTIKTAPLSSFSTSWIEASSFAEESRTGKVIAAVVPRKQIIGIPGTGFGCLEENEVVALGGKIRCAVVSVNKTGDIDAVNAERFLRHMRKLIDTGGKKNVGDAVPNIDEDLVDADWPKRTKDKLLGGEPSVEKYSQAQPRDREGQWTSTGAAQAAKERPGYGAAHWDAANKKYVESDGKALPEHVQAAKIPPGWQNIIYSISPNENIIAQGRDKVGKLQAIYKEEFKEGNADAKWARVNALDKEFSGIKSSVDKDVRKGVEEASVLRLIMSTGLRPGSAKDTKAKVKAYGAVTLIGKHVTVDKNGAVILKFPAKKGTKPEIPVTDPAIAKDMLARKKQAGENGALFNSSYGKLNKYTASRDDGGFETKDFRTLHGTRTAMKLVASMPKPKTEKEYQDAVKVVATKVSKVLGNTPKVAIASYINPAVFAGWKIGAGR